MLTELKLSCGGYEYAQATIVQGKLLPLEFSFNTFHRNGILLYASDKDSNIVSGYTLTINASVSSFLSFPTILGRPGSFKSVLSVDML